MLQHGLNSGADCWVLDKPSQSLGFWLVDQGYDAWLSNTRGCNWAPVNTLHPVSSKAYWNFTFDDMIAEDFPASLALVARVTGSRVAVVGHSQGTLMTYGALATDPRVQETVSCFVALAPVAHVGHVKSIVLRAMADLHAGLILELLGDKSFGFEPRLIQRLLPAFCRVDPRLCKDVISLTTGYNCCINSTQIPFYLTLEPSETSVKNMVHYTQLIRSGAFARYDYGKHGNEAAYGQPTPPPYDIGAIPPTIPIQMHWGGRDDLGDTKDVALIVAALRGAPEVFEYPEFAHLDFVIGTTVGAEMFPRILAFLKANA
jgi:lysosomal acid lipase/cholesteryl ester hydrolase